MRRYDRRKGVRWRSYGRIYRYREGNRYALSR
jgi:hypothetical protein